MDQDDVRFHRGKVVPLEGPFLGCFSQGNFGEMNENTHFSDFRIFCYFDPTSLGSFSLLRLVILSLLRLRISTPPHQVMKDPQRIFERSHSTSDQTLNWRFKRRWMAWSVRKDTKQPSIARLGTFSKHLQTFHASRFVKKRPPKRT